MAEPTDMIMPMLGDMRAENEARHGEVLAQFDRVEQRLKKLEDAQVSLEAEVRDLEARQ
jgi:hypothetical protein